MLKKIDPAIHFLIIVPDNEPEKATPLQGFSLSLCENHWLIRTAAILPSTIYDLTKEGIETRLERKVAGANPINWYPQSVAALTSVPWPEILPFAFILFGPETDVRPFRDWANKSKVPPCLVAKTHGDLTYEDLTVDGLQKRLLQVCTTLKGISDADQIEILEKIISSWEKVPEKSMGYQVGGHNSITPNLMSLTMAGYSNLVSGPFSDINRGPQPYIDQIVRTSKSILEIRGSVAHREIYRTFPRTPDLNLFAPAIYPHFFTLALPDNLSAPEKKAFRMARAMLQKQSGYGFDATTEAQAQVLMGVHEDALRAGETRPKPHPLFLLRSRELALNTEGVGALAASELSAVIRLPNEINRTSGTIRQFAEHYRSDQRNSRKRLLAFKGVQTRLAKAVPQEFVDLIKESQDGIRIIANAHLEWLDIDGLPLALRKTVSRLPVTPGNLFIENLAPKPALRLMPEDFRKIIVLSALKRDDPIKRFFEIAFNEFGKEWKDTLEVTFAEISCEKDLIDALNGFDGPLVIFDGHGSHRTDEPAKLHLMDDEIDVWQLRGKLKGLAPPIVLLSACDTHAADRNHATVANGFMGLGSRAVLASVFPLHAFDAALFSARLLYRISTFVPAAVGLFGRALTWTEVVSGMLKMQYQTDFLKNLMFRSLITEEIYVDIHQKGNIAINSGHENPFEEIVGLLTEAGLDERTIRQEMDMALAHSSVISYLNIGRPETVLLDTRKDVEERMMRLME